MAYIGSDAVATSNEFAIAWEEAVAAEYIYVYSPGEGNGSNDFDYVTEGTQITLYTPEYMGYSPIDGFTFDYWSIRVGTAQSAEIAQKQPGDQITIEDNTYIIAIWKEAPLTEYIYVYGPGDGQGSNDFDYVTNGTEITLSTPESMGFTPTEGFTFDYWSIRTGDTAMNPEIAQKQPGDTIIINDDTYIIAIWKALPHECVGLLESGQGATCAVDGWNDYYRCECGQYYEDADCQMPISDLEAWKVGAGKTTKDHEPNADDGDCTTDITCSVCGEVITEGADSHTGGTATCEKKAECAVCGKEYGELADHSFVEGKCECGETDPNYQPPHTHTFVEGKCECGETDPNYVPPHTHTFVEGKCECGETDPNYVPPHEHNFVEGKCECGETDPGYTPDTDAPDTDAPDTDAPDTDASDTDASDTDVPGTDVPGTDKPEDPDDGLSGGAIAGIVTGSVVVLGGGGFALWWFVFRKKKLF